MEYVIDTNVLVVVNDPKAEKFAECNSFAWQVWKGQDALVLDFEGEIRTEYDKYARFGTNAYTWLHSMLRKRNKVVSYTSSQPQRMSSGLDRLKFDTKDRKFAAVASRTADDPHILVNATDSDWTPEVCEWLMRTYHILVISADPQSQARIAAGS